MFRKIINYIKGLFSSETRIIVPDELKEDIRRIFPIGNFPNADKQLIARRINSTSHHVVFDSGELAFAREFENMVITPPLCLYVFIEMCLTKGVNPLERSNSSDDLDKAFEVKKQIMQFAAREDKLRQEIIELIDARRKNLKKDGKLIDASQTALLESILMCDDKSWNSLSLIYELVNRSIVFATKLRLKQEDIENIFGQELHFRLFDLRKLEVVSASA